ncbi:unnamed protein product (mitochondrion) [Plasmodiophora brassicae]|uniref:RING-type E3 ubiquitin transferase n=1 Tax=Plasmodiophora brassicae TaxID=37360 RepID=A0A0G4INP6_PLABS|nr:hypothetical protein PBRA_005418 [Plasmodiophora brassicae]SPR00643.1 unnamed protein product [Plasmodiophora brassicae]
MPLDEDTPLSAALQCPICYSAMTTPVILPCSHSYCSMCIRRWLSAKKSCPVCSEQADPSQIIPNRALEHAIAVLTCEGNQTRLPQNQRCPSMAQPRERLPRLAVAMVKDSTIRERLRRYGLSDKGARAELVRRYEEYEMAYEANQDKAVPDPVSRVVQRFNREDHSRPTLSQDVPASQTKLRGSRQADPFQRLIAQAQQQRPAKRYRDRQPPASSEGGQPSTEVPERPAMDDPEMVTNVPPPWRVVWLEQYDRKAFYNPETRTMQWRLPNVPAGVVDGSASRNGVLSENDACQVNSVQRRSPNT